VEIANDAFQGYYSFLAHHPEFRVDWAVHSRVSLVARAEARWRLYGPWSYAAGPDHPPLLWGDRRTDVRGALDLEVRVALGNGFFAVLDLRGVLRRTNYPPYVPGVFPATRQYDIRWDYENASALLALEYAYETGAAERGD
jgi:hypothetical protein